MKWLKFKNEMDLNMLTPEEQNFFEEIPPVLKEKMGADKNKFSEALEAMLKKKGFVEWVTHPQPGCAAMPNLGKGAVRKYEIFCGGFLYYHDVEFKKYPEGKGYTDEKGYPEWKVYPHNKFEHKIFFEWLPKGGKIRNKVRIYINKTPAKFNGNPPKPPAPPPPES